MVLQPGLYADTPSKNDDVSIMLEYWEDIAYIPFEEEIQQVLSDAIENDEKSKELFVRVSLPHLPRRSKGTSSHREFVTIKDLDKIDISLASFYDGAGVPRHVRRRPPEQGDEELVFMYKWLDTNDWNHFPEKTQKSLRRCYSQHPFPQCFNFEMDSKAYAMGDFHKVDDCQAYFQSLVSTGQGKRIRINEEGLVQQKLCHAAFNGFSRDKLRNIIADGANINKAAKKGDLTALGYAVMGNHLGTVEDLINLEADVNLLIRSKTTALTLALNNEIHENTEMVRRLLALGAEPAQVQLLDPAAKSAVQENLSIMYWLERASKRPCSKEKFKERLSRLKQVNLDRIPLLEFSVVGQEAAVRYIVRRIQGFYHPPFSNKPLVILALGPPGHGKTEFTRHLAGAITSHDAHKLLEISCSSLRDDADLFGSRLGGFSGGRHSSTGQLTEFLRKHNKERSVVLLDEFEKIRDLTSALGWRQDKKIYQALLEPWQEGVITDHGAGTGAGEKISVCNTVFVLTSNIGQDKTLQFAERYENKMSIDISEGDVEWVQKELVKKELLPCIRKFFQEISPELQALVSRIDCIVPFLPFTRKEQTVIADMELRKFFGEYRSPPNSHEGRPMGNLLVTPTLDLTDLATESYDPMEGARSMQRITRDVHGKLVDMYMSTVLDEAEQVKVGNSTFSKVYASSDEGGVKISLEPPKESEDAAANSDEEGLPVEEAEVEDKERQKNLDEDGGSRELLTGDKFDRSQFAELPRF